MKESDRPFDPPAPPGYEVHEGKPCERCIAYALADVDLCRALPPCTALGRPDGRWVYFTRATPKEEK